jgi:hypothetical protein
MTRTRRTLLVLAGVLTLGMGWCTADLFVLRRGITVAKGPDGDPYRIRPGSWVTQVTGTDETTIGRTVHLRFEKRPSAYLYAHAWRHLEQREQLGTPWFELRYLVDRDWVREIEADAHRYGCANREHPHFAYIVRVMARVSLDRTEAPPAGLYAAPQTISCEDVTP